MACVNPIGGAAGYPGMTQAGTTRGTHRINVVKATKDGCMKELELRVRSDESVQGVMDRVQRQFAASKFETIARKILLSEDIAVYKASVHSVSVCSCNVSSCADYHTACRVRRSCQPGICHLQQADVQCRPHRSLPHSARPTSLSAFSPGFRTP